MAQQTLAELVVQVREQGLAGLEATVEKLRPKLTQVENAAQNVQKALGSGFQQAASQAQTTMSKLSAVTSQIQGNLHGVAASLQAANDNLKTVTPSVQALSANASRAGAELSQLENELAEVAQQTTRTELASERLEREYRELRTTADRLQKEVDELRQALDKQTAAARRASTAKANISRAANQANTAVTRLTSHLVGLAAAYISVNTAISLAQRSMENTRALIQLSAATGTSIEQLSALKVAAEASGVSFSELTQVITTFGNRMADAVVNPTNETAQALRALGVSIQDIDGNIRSFADILPELADRFASYEDGINKTILANQIFGEGVGFRLLPLLNRGRNGIEQLITSARRYGLIISNEAIEKTRRFQQASSYLSNALDAIARELTILASERLQPVIDKILELLRYLNATQKTFSGGTGGTVLKDMERLRDVLAEIESVRSYRESAIGRFMEGLTERFSPETAKQMREELSKLIDERDRLLERIHGPQIDTAWQQRITPPPPTGGAGGLSELAQAAQAAQQKAMQEAIDIVMQQTGLLENLILTYGDYASAVEEAEKRIREAHEHTWEAEMQIADMRKNLQRQQQQALLDTVQMAGQTLTALFPKSKAAAVAEAVMNTAVGVTRALRDVPWPLNWIQAGLVAAAGAAQIAAIRSTNMSGGGGFPRAGATGGSVSPAPQGGAAAPPMRAINITMRKGDFWSSEAVAELISRINDEAQNGRIVIATRTIPM